MTPAKKEYNSIIKQCVLPFDVKKTLIRMSDGAETNGGSEGGLPEIELIIKASTIDGRRKGACLFCQVRRGEIDST